MARTGNKQRLKRQALSPEQVRCITLPLRHQMLELFTVHGPCAVTDIAAYLDTYPEGLYHHLKQMIEVGLIRPMGSRRRGRHNEATYDAVATANLLRPQPWDDAYVEAALKLFKTQFKIAANQCSDATRRFRSTTPLNAFRYVRHIDFELDARAVEDLRKKLLALDKWLIKKRNGKGARTHSLFMTISPLGE